MSSAESSATGVGSLPVNEDGDDNEAGQLQQQQQQPQQPPEAGSRVTPALCRRSRTDSLIIYTPPSVAEAAGATFYIKRSGEVDYVVLLKVNICEGIMPRPLKEEVATAISMKLMQQGTVKLLNSSNL